MANCILAAILSFFIPGLGQAYAGNIKKGIFFFAVSILVFITIGLVFQEWVYYVVDVLVSIYIAYDAYLLAKE